MTLPQSGVPVDELSVRSELHSVGRRLAAHDIAPRTFGTAQTVSKWPDAHVTPYEVNFVTDFVGDNCAIIISAAPCRIHVWTDFEIRAKCITWAFL